MVLDDYTIRIDFPQNDKLTLSDLAVLIPAIFNSKLAWSHDTDKDPGRWIEDQRRWRWCL